MGQTKAPRACGGGEKVRQPEERAEEITIDTNRINSIRADISPAREKSRKTPTDRPWLMVKDQRIDLRRQ